VRRAPQASASSATPRGRSLPRVWKQIGLAAVVATALACVSSPAATAACPNEAFRTGPSAQLPNCRAYERVTPSHLNGIPQPGTGAGAGEVKFNSALTSADGSSYIWTVAATGVPGSGSSGYFNFYQATRSESDWGSLRLSPSAFEAEGSNPGSVSGDLGYSTVQVEGFRGGSLAICSACFVHYVRYPDGSFHLLGEGTVPTGLDTDGFDNGKIDDLQARARWISSGGDHQIFTSAVQLTPEAPAARDEIYDRTSTGLHLVSLLPGEVPPTASSLFEGSSEDGSTVLFSNGSGFYARLDNANTLAIASGDAVRSGTVLTCSTTTTGATNSLQWLRNGAPIPGATSADYTTGAADEGKVLQCLVTSTNVEGGSRKASAPVTVAPAPAESPPAPGVPFISGTANVGQTQTCNTGSWSGSPVFGFQWLRNGAPIPGATASTYVLAAADKGTAVQCEVTGTNAGGAAVAQSANRLVNSLPPTASVNPSISGTLATGETLTCNPGTWANSPSFSYEWLRSGAPIPGATSQTYLVAVADESQPLQCRVTATNGDSVAQAVAPRVVVPPPPGTTPPSLTTPGTVTGTPNVGNTLTCNQGIWANSPSFAFQWLRNGVAIPGATNNTYALVAADREKSIQCRLTATNAGGSVIATNASASNGSRYVNPKPPVATATTPSLSVTSAGVSADGSRAFYLQAGNAFAVETETGGATRIAGVTDTQVANISADGSHVYFVSSSIINGEGIGGQPNLYVWDGSSISFIVTVDPEDLFRPANGERPTAVGLTKWAEPGPEEDHNPAHNGFISAETSQTTRNGKIFVFESKAQLTSYPNAGHIEIYRFDTDSDMLDCVSCSRSEPAATSDSQLVAEEADPPIVPVYPMNRVLNLSADGKRVVFDSKDTLLRDDVNGKRDVYQWEGGELSLISAGASAQPTRLFGVSPSGDDIFFATGQRLVADAQEAGSVAVYDARVGGGLASQQLQQPVDCVGDACQGQPASAPQLPAPGSSAFNGKGNVKKARCHRRRHKRHRHKADASKRRGATKACHRARRRAAK
jgi:hypothetical protein